MDERKAKRLPGEMDEQVIVAQELAFGQAPLPAQQEDALDFLEACGATDDLAALAEYCHVLMNANAFLYVD